MFEKLSKHKKTIFLTIVVGIIGGPIIIHVLYKMKTNNPFVWSEWSAGELLAYYGNALSFIGTLVLSLLALWQNHDMCIQNIEHKKQLEEIEYKSNLPYFTVEKIMSEKRDMNLEMSLTNQSNNMAYGVEIFGVKMCENDDVIWISEKKFEYHVIKPGENVHFQLDNIEVNNDAELKFNLNYYDKYLKQHYLVGKVKKIQNKLIGNIMDEIVQQN